MLSEADRWHDAVRTLDTVRSKSIPMFALGSVRTLSSFRFLGWGGTRRADIEIESPVAVGCEALQVGARS